ncbi:hypothetical protein ANO14919_079380 [Xylariales sp. No.14919]|nr:hypothetical protein ANO14919_079380 [Xylariales sp. No.14919]
MQGNLGAMDTIGNRRLASKPFKPSRLLKMSLSSSEDDPIAIAPNPHETDKDDTILENGTYADNDSAEEEILRPNLRAPAGASRARDIESLLDSFLAMKSGQQGKSRGRTARFPGVTEETATSSQCESSTGTKIKDVFSGMGELNNEDTDSEDINPEDINYVDTDLEDLARGRGDGAEERVRSEWKPIHFAAKGGRANLIKAYIEKGAVVDSREDNNATPLIIAAGLGHLEACRVLLNYGADVNAQEREGDTALMRASAGAKADVVRLLLSEGADPSACTTSGWTPLFVLAMHWVLEKDHECVSEIAEALIDAGADPDTPTDECSPLSISVMGGASDVVAFFLEHGADPNQRVSEVMTCLQIAGHEAKPDIITLLLQYGADVDYRVAGIATALHHTVRRDKKLALDAARVLVRGGADIDALTEDGASTLHLVVQAGRLDVAHFLLSEGTQRINHAEVHGITPLGLAVFKGNLDMVNLLLEHGASAEVVDKRGFNMVHIAAEIGDIRVFERILDTGADIDLVSSDGHNIRPLDLASERESDEFAFMLLERGAKP